MTTPPPGSVNPPAGWYPDPSGQPGQRWWDGSAWTEQTQQAPSAAPGSGYPAYGSGQGYGGSPGYGSGPGYGTASGYGGPGGAPRQSNGLAIAGIICGAIAFLFIPILLGPVGLILGGIAKSRGQRLANAALIVSGLGLVVGLLLGYIAFKNMVA
jgi:hypothetical protein